MTLACAVIALVIGTVLFHFLSPWWFTPIASNWTTMDDTVNLTFWVTGAVFVAVNLFMAYCIVRYLHRKGTKAHYEPENKKLEWWLTIVTSVGIAAMLAPGLLVWAKFVTVPAGASEMEVVGSNGISATVFPARMACSAPRMFAWRVRRIRSRSTPMTPRVRTMWWYTVRKCICPSASR